MYREGRRVDMCKDNALRVSVSFMDDGEEKGTQLYGFRGDDGKIFLPLFAKEDLVIRGYEEIPNSSNLYDFLVLARLNEHLIAEQAEMIEIQGRAYRKALLFNRLFFILSAVFAILLVVKGI